MAVQSGAITQGTHEIARQLASFIDLRRFRPGTRLPSAADLSIELGVSRPVVLRALELLAADGRVTVKRGRGGVVVNQVPKTDRARIAWLWQHQSEVRQMAIVREALEPQLASLAAERGLSQNDDARLDELVERMPDATDDSEARYLDSTFHNIVGKAANAPLIFSIAQDALRWVASTYDLLTWPTKRRPESNRQHREILSSLRDRDPLSAERLMKKHVGSTRKIIEETLESVSRDMTQTDVVGQERRVPNPK